VSTVQKHWFVIRDEVVRRDDGVNVRIVESEERSYEESPLVQAYYAAYRELGQRGDPERQWPVRTRSKGPDHTRRGARELFVNIATEHARTALGELPDDFEARLRNASDDAVDELISEIPRARSRVEATTVVERLLPHH